MHNVRRTVMSTYHNLWDIYYNFADEFPGLVAANIKFTQREKLTLQMQSIFKFNLLGNSIVHK
jgi:hypothetical protein